MLHISKAFSKRYFLLFSTLVSTTGIFAQNNTLLQGEIKKSDGTPFSNGRVYLQWPEIKAAVDSVSTDGNGVFQFQKFPYGNYSIGVNLPDVDNAVADVISINTLNPAKQNQHFKVDDGSLVCIESNYGSLKDAMENRENVFELDLNNLQFDVAEKSLSIGTDGSKKLSPRVGEFSNLEVLTLDINNLVGLPMEMGNLKKLMTFSAHLNKLNSLPAEMANLKNMKNLNLGKNTFTAFPDVISHFTLLEALNLESNAIPALPGSIGLLKKLKELNLANCRELTVLPPQLGELTSLETLDISGCDKLKSLPDEIVNLKNLKVLDVTGTKVSTKDFQKAVPGCEVRK